MIWVTIFNNDDFIVEYSPSEKIMRVSYFNKRCFQEECIFTFQLRCINCKYLINDMKCSHPNASHCLHGELWWPRSKEED